MRFGVTICLVAILLVSAYAETTGARDPSKQYEQQEQNPYVFEDRHFTTGLQTQHGRLRILQNFAERSNLLQGIANYRVAILEIQPQTFVVPSHWDADSLAYVQQGRGTLSTVGEDGRESINVKQGDILWVDAGTPHYLINGDKIQNLVVVKLVRPVSTPGQFEAFFPAGDENPSSFLSAFSDGLLEAALNTRKEKMQRVLSQQRQGAILKATEEQIRVLSRESGSIWPFGGQSTGRPVNIFDQRPTHSNQYGKFYEVDANRYRPLKDNDVAVSLANVTRGSMIAPYFNSEATKVIVVDGGDGYLEMACPHLSQQQQPQQQRYEKVSAVLRRGTVVVVPAGHPFLAVASNNQNLQLVCFEINAKNNKRHPLVGKRSIVNRFQKEAKELAFGVSEREVDDVFGSQNDEFFVRGPQGQPQKGYADA